MFLSPVRPPNCGMKVWAPVGAEGSVSRTEKTPLFQNGHNFTVNLGHGETSLRIPYSMRTYVQERVWNAVDKNDSFKLQRPNPETQLLRLAEGNCLCFHC